MKYFTRMVVLLAVALAVCVLPGRAQLASNIVSIALSASNSESVTLSCDTASLSFSPTVTSNTFHCTTAWNLSPTRTNLAVAAFFATGTALTGPGAGIPASAVLGTGAGGTTGNCAQSVPFPDGGHMLQNSCGLLVNPTTITTANDIGTITSPFTLAIPTLTSFAAGTFNGTLQIEVMVL